MTDIPQLVANALARDADRPAIEFEGRWFGWGELRKLAQEVIDGLERQGVAPDASVAFVPRNHPASIAALLALMGRGRTIKMVYAFQSAEGIARDIARLQCGAAVLHATDQSEGFDQWAVDANLPYVILDGMRASYPHMPEPSATIQAASTTLSETAGQGTHIAILTSGTTGPPKQFPLYYSTIESYFLSSPLTDAQAADVAKAPPFLLYFPLGNITGIYATVPMLLRGQPLVLLDRFHLTAWHEYVLRYRPSHSGLPASAFQQLLESDIPVEDLSSLTALGTGAAPLNPSVQAACEERYGIPILLSYGATEFAGPVAMMTADLHRTWGTIKRGSVGRALPGAELRVVDINSQEILPSGQDGLLHVRVQRMGPNWIATSDLGCVDADGFLFLKGRADGAIMRGGFKILPETVERALVQHPAIAEAVVVGIADPRLGQVPAALVRIQKDMNKPTVQELETELRRHLLATHIPVKWRFCTAIPLNPSQKVDRVSIRQDFERT